MGLDYADSPSEWVRAASQAAARQFTDTAPRHAEAAARLWVHAAEQTILREFAAAMTGTNIPAEHENIRARLRSMTIAEAQDHLRMCRLSILIAEQLGIGEPK